jgi:two-component sensor histidine kinase
MTNNDNQIETVTGTYSVYARKEGKEFSSAQELRITAMSWKHGTALQLEGCSTIAHRSLLNSLVRDTFLSNYEIERRHLLQTRSGSGRDRELC